MVPGEPEPVVLVGEETLRTWEIVDRTAPETTIDSGPSGTTTDNDVVITFSANELEVEFQCSLNDAPFEACSSPLELLDSAIGDYKLEVFATDGSGNVDEEPAVRSWRVAAPPTPNTSVGTNVVVNLTSPVAATVTFDRGQRGGLHVPVELRDTAPPLPLGYSTDGAVYYDLNTTAEYSAPVTVCLPFDPNAYGAARAPAPPRRHRVDRRLADRRRVAGTICGEVESLSPFAIVAGDATVAPDTTISIKPDAVTPEPVRHVRVRVERPVRRASSASSIDLPGARVGLVRRRRT